MSIWSRLMGIKDTGNANGVIGEKNVSYDSLR